MYFRLFDFLFSFCLFFLILTYIDKLCILISFLGLRLDAEVFIYMIFRHFGDFCTNFIFIAEFVNRIPEQLRKKLIFAVTSPKQIIYSDQTFLHANYGPFDDYAKLIEKDQFIFRPHFRYVVI